MAIRTKILLFISSVIMLAYIAMGFLVALSIIPQTATVYHLTHYAFVLFVGLFSVVVYDHVGHTRKIRNLNTYFTRLSDVLISQSENELFYAGEITAGAKELTREVAENLSVDRCSIWLYSDLDKQTAYCEQMYLKNESKWFSDMVINRSDFECYFTELDQKRIVAANQADKHPATACFFKSYSLSKGIKSIMNVPIIYRNEIIGFICIGSTHNREWMDVEINFVRTLSALYSFAFSINENNAINKTYMNLESFVDRSVMYSKTDDKGNIVYVNKKFEEVTGWKLKDIIGKNHSVMNTDVHTAEFWEKMYKTTAKDKKIWNAIVTNRDKKGNLIWIDQYVKGEFDEEDNLVGYSAIGNDVSDVIKNSQEIEKKNAYLEYAAKIIRHDMHSGINIYIPRGVSSLERRLDENLLKEYKLESPLKMLKEGLKHTQKVYKGVYDFTNLVKPDSVLETQKGNTTQILKDYFGATAYADQVVITKLPQLKINESLFCTAIDNLVRNGLKYNDSETKVVKIYAEKNIIVVEDNGRGMSQADFNKLSIPYKRKTGQKETGTGLGLNICIAILKEHGFDATCERVSTGTKIKIKVK